MLKMLENTYLHLLILCGIFYHGIFAKLLDVDTRESSDFLVREKRVISHLPGGLSSVRIESVNYLIKIKEGNYLHCGGAILTHQTVITAALCLQRSLLNYKVLSGPGDERHSHRHDIRSKLTYFGNLPHGSFDGIALITVNPPFVYDRKTGNIQLYTGPLSTGTEVSVSGWGFTYPPHPVPNIEKRLRTITLPIMNHAECQAAYSGHFNVTDKHLCTYCPNQHCARRDIGVPLVINNKLAGIHIWKGETGNARNPDVFINLHRADYSEWIREHIILL